MDAENKIEEILERLVRMETKLDDFSNLREKAENAYSTSNQNKQDIGEIRDNIKWLWRTGLGAIIVAVVGLVIKFK